MAGRNLYVLVERNLFTGEGCVIKQQHLFHVLVLQDLTVLLVAVPSFGLTFLRGCQLLRILDNHMEEHLSSAYDITHPVAIVE